MCVCIYVRMCMYKASKNATWKLFVKGAGPRVLLNVMRRVMIGENVCILS